MLLEKLGHGRLLSGLLDQSAQGAVAEEAVLQGVAARPVHPFTWVAAGQADQSLQQAVRAHATLDDHRLGPGQRVWTDVFGFAEQDGFIRGLTRWSMQRAVFTPGGVRAGFDAQVDGDRLPLTIGVDAIHAHQMAIPLGAYLLADEGVRHRIERAIDLDVSIGMHRAAANLEQAEWLAGQWLEQRLLHFEKMPQHLLTRGAVDAQLRDGAVPVLEMPASAARLSKRRPFNALDLT